MTPHPPAPLRPVSDEHRHEPADYELEPNELAAEAIRRVWQEYDLPVGPTMFRKMADEALTTLTQAPRACCDAAARQDSTIRALEEAAIDLWEQSPEIAKINPWVRCEWSEISERSRIYWRGLALTTAIRSNSHDG